MNDHADAPHRIVQRTMTWTAGPPLGPQRTINCDNGQVVLEVRTLGLLCSELSLDCDRRQNGPARRLPELFASGVGGTIDRGSTLVYGPW